MSVTESSYWDPHTIAVDYTEMFSVQSVGVLNIQQLKGSSLSFTETSFSLYITLIEEQLCNWYKCYKQKEKDITKINQHIVFI